MSRLDIFEKYNGVVLITALSCQYWPEEAWTNTEHELVGFKNDGVTLSNYEIQNDVNYLFLKQIIKNLLDYLNVEMKFSHYGVE